MPRRANRQPTAYSKVSVKNQTVLPRVVREVLNIRTGDTLRYRVTKQGVLLGKVSPAGDAPFTVFSEWAGEADEKAYADL